MTTEKSSGGWGGPWQGEFTKIPGEASDLGPLVRQEVPGDRILPEQGRSFLSKDICSSGAADREEGPKRSQAFCGRDGTSAPTADSPWGPVGRPQ